jgi:hypothetical protein
MGCAAISKADTMSLWLATMVENARSALGVRLRSTAKLPLCFSRFESGSFAEKRSRPHSKMIPAPMFSTFAPEST